MKYLCVMFIPPLYFMIRGMWGAFTLNAILYGLAWLCVISIIGIIVAPLFWVLSVGHATWHLRTELMAQHADMIATKMAEKMGGANQGARPVPPPIQPR